MGLEAQRRGRRHIEGNPHRRRPLTMAAEKDPEFPGEEQEASFHPQPTWMERGCMLICEIGIVVIAVVVLTEIVTRNLFGFSFEAPGELGGNIAVGISSLTFRVCRAY